MNITGQLSKTPGIPRIIEMFLANLRQPQRPTAGTKAGVSLPSPDLPMYFRKLQQQMTEHTERRLAQDTYYTVRRLISLSELQFLTLSEIGVSEPDIRSLQALNYLLPHHENYAVNDRLDVIATTPLSPPDWKEWWFHYRDSIVGIRRPQDHDPVKDPASENLNRIIDVMAAAALPYLPTVSQICDRMVAEAGKERKGKAVRVSDVYICASQLIRWAEGVRVPAEKTGFQDLTPESIAAVLQETGADYQTDMGTIGTVAELKQILPTRNLADIRTSAVARLWWGKKSSGYWIPMSARKNYQQYSGVKPDPEAELSQAEYRLIQLGAPDNPLSEEHYRMPNPAAATIGWLNRMTPQQVLAVLNDRPSPPDPDPCPEAAHCQSWCGHLQTAGEYPFPLTDDGDYQSCVYWRFLSRNANSDPVSRELAAQQTISEWVERQSRKERRDPAYNPDPDWDEEQALDAEPKPPAVRQATLL